jgi:hypothetical protein
MAQGKRRDLKLEGRWRQALGRYERSGLTAREFCQRAGLKESVFHFWKRELARRDTERPAPQSGGRSGTHRPGPARRLPSLVPVSIGPAMPPAAPVEVLLPQGLRVRVGSGCEEALLRMVLSALERVS